ncbi:UAA transporter family-domain-containing protein [Entophlyctis helioformis]|nr:UAA transporter family-domain-containing protein [Entophlyctis helioformis]
MRGNSTHLASVAPLLFVREWLLVGVLIFGGCCTCVYTLELLIRSAPKSGTLITFAQFLFVAVEGLVSNIQWAAPRDAPLPLHSPVARKSLSQPPLDAAAPLSSDVSAVSSANSTPDRSRSKSLHNTLAGVHPPPSPPPPPAAAAAAKERAPWRFPLRLRPRVIPLSRWVSMVALFLTSSVINNHALRYRLAMPVHIIFRSGSLLVSMIMTWFMFRRRFPRGQVVGVVLVTVGIIMTTLRPSAVSPVAPADEVPLLEILTGVSILTFGLVLTCFLGLLQQQTYAHYGQQWREGLFYMHALGLPAFVFMYADLKAQVLDFHASPLMSVGEAFESFLPGSFARTVWGAVGGHALRSLHLPEMWVYLAWNVLTQYVCISGVHKLSSMASAVTLNLILTVRKFVSLVLSVMIFKNEFTAYNWMGAVAVFLGTIVYSTARTAKPKASSPSSSKTGTHRLDVSDKKRMD